MLVTYATLHPVNRPMCVNRIESKSVAPRNKCVVPCDLTGKLKFFFRLESGIHSCLQTIFVPNPSSLLRGCDIINTKNGRYDNEYYSRKKETVTNSKYFSLIMRHSTDIFRRLKKTLLISDFGACVFHEEPSCLEQHMIND